MSNVLRGIPSVSEMLESPPLKSLVQRVNRNVVVTGIRQFLDDMRVQVQSAAANVHVPAPADLAQRIADWIATDQKSAILPVVNATGIVLHPRLGNAPLADEAIQAIAATARGYANVEFDLKSGEPCERLEAVEGLLVKLTGAEAATVVNTRAAAVWLALAALCAGREIVVSRGQLIEFEHSFRLPEIIAASGAVLREVGTINITRVADYAAAITRQTAALMRVHASNCEIVRRLRTSRPGRAGCARAKARFAPHRRYRQRRAPRFFSLWSEGRANGRRRASAPERIWSCSAATSCLAVRSVE